MNSLKVEMEGNQLAFKPGDEIRGSASWQLESIPAGLEVRLFWHTLGKGDSDVEIAATQTIAATSAQGRERFLFEAPDSPSSFSGQLISVSWAVELVVVPGGRHAGRQPIVISPTGEEIVLGPLPDSEKAEA